MKIFLTLLLLLIGVSPAVRAAGPKAYNIPCPPQTIQIPEGQNKLLRAKGDATAWSFGIVPQQDVKIKVSSWKFNGQDPLSKALADDGWGLFTGGGTGLSLGWSSPNKTGTFTISVKFRRWCGNGGGGGGQATEETLEWSGEVKEPAVELVSATFSGNHKLQKDDGTYASSGLGAYRTPEVEKVAGTGQGADPETAISYQDPSPLCYTWESKLSVSANFGLMPEVPEPGISAKVKVTGSAGEKTLNFKVQDVTLKGSSASATFVDEAGLDKKVDNANLVLKWEISFDDAKTWKLIADTTNKLFVTAGSPAGSDATYTRISGVTTGALGLANEEAIVKGLWKKFIHPNTKFDLNTDVAPEPLWKQLDPALVTRPKSAGQCKDISGVFQQAALLLGLPAAQSQVLYVYPDKGKTARTDQSPTKPSSRVIKDALGFLFGHTEAHGHHRVIPLEPMTYLDYGGGYNNFEACFTYKLVDGRMLFFAPGTNADDVYNNAQEVMNAVCKKTYWTYFYTEPQDTTILQAFCENPGLFPAEIWR